MNRRNFLSSILAAGVAPFVVRAESLMAVRVPASGLIVLDDVLPIAYTKLGSRILLHGVSSDARLMEAFADGSFKKLGDWVPARDPFGVASINYGIPASLLMT